MFAALAALLAVPCGAHCAGALPDCLLSQPAPIAVRIGPEAAAPAEALLEGGTSPPLRVVDRRTGAILWSAGAFPPASQLFEAMRAAFAGSLAPVDLDGDGLHDRIYAGDLAGRIWRFDVHHGAPAAQWLSGGVFADFGEASGRGFVAPPDVSLSQRAGEAPWFDIAIGTASPAGAAADNRYYVLRDHVPFEAWTDAQYLGWTPITEADLAELPAMPDAAWESPPAGYFVRLGRGQVYSPSITIAGRAVLAIAGVRPTAAGGCRVLLSIAALTLDRPVPADAEVPIPGGHSWLTPLPGLVPADAGFALEARGNAALCMIGGEHVADCDVATAPVLDWWRREDAE